jgi:AcrR family transcriptional regulator
MTELDARPRPRRRGRPVGADSARTRAQIVDAARTLIAAKGYPAATFQALSAASGFGRTTLHYYFDSLDTIYQALMAEASEVIMRCITMAGMESTLPDQLAAYIAEFGRSSVSDRATVVLLSRSRLASSQAPAPVCDPAVEVRRFLTRAVGEAIGRGELPIGTDVPIVVDLLYSVFWGIGFYAGLADDPNRLEAVTRQLGDVFKTGLVNGVG